MPGHRANDAAVGHSFGLEVDGVRVTMLTEVSGLGWERDVIEVREGGDPDATTRRLPGRMKPGEVTLTRGLSTDLTFEQWMRDPVPVGRPRRTVSVALFDTEGQAVARYHLEHAWPSKLQVTGLRSGGTEVALESLTLVHEGLERV
jgi:phage tail-like protein